MKPRSARSPSRRLQERGVALILVLAFVVLLTGLVIAYFSRSMNARALSNNSFNQLKSDQLARSAIDIIVADFKQEIVAGSTSTSVGSGSNQSTIYTPSTPANVVPTRSGNPPLE